MTCKIKGALLFDDSFMRAFGEVVDNIQLPYKEAFTVYKLGNEMGLAFQTLDEKRMGILEKHSVKNNKGKTNKDGEGNWIFRDKREAEEELLNELNKDIELNCEKLSTTTLEKGVITPSLINAIALLNPILEMEA